MPDRLRFTLLGCGSSPGTPRVTGDWGACDPAEPRNRRTRAAALIERVSESGTTRVVIDTGPDFRQQMLSVPPARLDAVVYTHGHADHIHGIDDLRSFVLDQRHLIPVYADRATLDRLIAGFGYCFQTPPGSSYPPIVHAHLIEHGAPFTIEGRGGPLTILPLPQLHGDALSLGVKVGPLAYCSDASDFPPDTAAKLSGLDLLVIDALQYRTHPSHFSFAEALDWVARLAPRRAILTHMHTPLDYRRLLAEVPPGVEPGFDGLTVELPLAEAPWP